MTRAQRWTLLAAIVASGIVFLDSTVVNLALKRIGQELPTTTSLGVLEAQEYVGSGYLAVLAALLIIAGALADRYGRRRIFTIGLASFGVVSVTEQVVANQRKRQQFTFRLVLTWPIGSSTTATGLWEFGVL